MTEAEPSSVLTVDVEDWFHILDSTAVPDMQEWHRLDSCLDAGIDALLEMLASTNTRATFFWLGWMAEKYPETLTRVHGAGHEIASHGYAHVLTSAVGKDVFREDVMKAKCILEDAIAAPVRGYRAPGFSVGDAWFLEVIRGAGHEYDSSLFPATHGHGGAPSATLVPHTVQTSAGPITEVPISMVEILGKRICMFGGGYLRLFPLPLIQWGISRLHAGKRHLVIYVHPRELVSCHPRLPLSLKRRFKSYVGLKTMGPKLESICERCSFVTMAELVATVSRSDGQG